MFYNLQQFGEVYVHNYTKEMCPKLHIHTCRLIITQFLIDCLGFYATFNNFSVICGGWLPNAFPWFQTSTRQLISSSWQLPHLKQRLVTKKCHPISDQFHSSRAFGHRTLFFFVKYMYLNPVAFACTFFKSFYSL